MSTWAAVNKTTAATNDYITLIHLYIIFTIILFIHYMDLKWLKISKFSHLSNHEEDNQHSCLTNDLNI